MMFSRLKRLFGSAGGAVAVHGAGRSHIGRVRATNEDAVLVSDDLCLYVVCDGLGGHRGGELASRCAIRAIEAAVRRGSDLNAALTAANESVGRLFQPVPGTTNNRPPGSTAVALLITDDHWQVAWVGDSRCWLFGTRGGKQLTTDHTVVQQLVSWGDISAEEALVHPDRHRLSQALGTRSAVTVGEIDGEVTGGQWFLLATDGLTRWNEPEELQRVVVGKTPERAVAELIDLSLADGGRDNISCVVVAVRPG